LKSPGAMSSGGRTRPTTPASCLYVDAGHQLSLQFHREKDETSYLLSGRLQLMRGPTAMVALQREDQRILLTGTEVRIGKDRRRVNRQARRTRRASQPRLA
jgi:mannose-6-phosphate isomerase-like protein (cupin superfamily)